MRSVNGLRSATVASGVDGPNVGAAQMPTATIIGRIASATNGCHDWVIPWPGTLVAIATGYNWGQEVHILHVNV